MESHAPTCSRCSGTDRLQLAKHQRETILWHPNVKRPTGPKVSGGWPGLISCLSRQIFLGSINGIMDSNAVERTRSHSRFNSSPRLAVECLDLSFSPDICSRAYLSFRGLNCYQLPFESLYFWERSPQHVHESLTPNSCP